MEPVPRGFGVLSPNFEGKDGPRVRMTGQIRLNSGHSLDQQFTILHSLASRPGGPIIQQPAKSLQSSTYGPPFSTPMKLAFLPRSVLGGSARHCRCLAILAALLALGSGEFARAANEKKAEQAEAVADIRLAPPQVRLISVPLPITGSVDTNVMQNVDRIVSELKPDGPRPVIVFEFKTTTGQTGEGSQFERAWSLARFLTSEKLSRVRTVAFVPNTLKGHAVLVALACEELVIAPDADFGEAGIGEKFVDAIVQRNYVDIAERRRIIPGPVVLGMLDKKAGVFKVQTTDGVRYVLAEDLEKLKKEAAVTSVDSVIPPGEMGRFSGRDLRLKFSFASHLAADRNELAAALQVPPQALQDDPSAGRGWQAIRIDLHGIVHTEVVNWITKSLNERLRQNQTNLVILTIDSSGGSLVRSLELANTLAELDPSRVRTVAFVSHQALADASLIALACDQLVMSDGARLGGEGDGVFNRDQLAAARTAIKELASRKQVNWSLMAAMIDDSITVHRYKREGTGAVRYLCDEELAELKDRDSWKRGAEIETNKGLSGREAEQYQLARYIASSFDELRQLYNLEKEPEAIRPNWAHIFIEGLASPKIAAVLLFVAWFALIIEFMTPGFTGAGFISGLCFLLYFWSQFLHGTAGWLEVLLFVAGICCVIAEIFVTPGFGILGFGGGVMVVASIILASQTFVIPRNSYQFEQLPGSLFMVIAAGSGAIISLALMRRYLPHAPMFKRLMLGPPDPASRVEIDHREALADYAHLMGQRGTTTTPLMPSGKARFGYETINVISDGEVIPRGADIYVAEVVGNRVLVREVGR